MAIALERNVKNLDLKNAIQKTTNGMSGYKIEMGIWDYIEDSGSINLCVWIWDNNDMSEMLLNSYVIEIKEDNRNNLDNHFNILLKEAKKIKKYLDTHFKNVILYDYIVSY